MNRICLAIATFFLVCTVSHATINVRRGENTLNRLTNNTLANADSLVLAQSLQERIVTNDGCNLNVCFALDGSQSLSLEDYERQKEFVTLIAGILSVDTDVEYAAVQYGLRNIRISRLTRNANRFLSRVESSNIAFARRSFIAAGLGTCIQELRRRPDDANKIVLLGDGRSNFGGNPVPLAQSFLPPRGTGSICTVGVGFQDTFSLEAIAGSPDRVIAIDGYFELLDILELLVADICGLPSISDAPIERKFEQTNVAKNVKSYLKV